MAYPTKYVRQYDFLTFQNANPTRPLPGDKVNTDYNYVVTSIGEIVDFLKTSLRSDGQIANAVVGRDQMSADLLALIDAANGSSIAGSQVTYDPTTSGLSATTVQAAIDEVVSASGAISGVFGRTGAISAAASDYDASQVDNDSGVSGTYVSDALDTLNSAISGFMADLVDDTSPQLGAALDGQGYDLNNLGVVFLTEQAAAEADVAGKGQLWVLTATPNVLKFTDDAGTDWTPSMAENLASTANGKGAALIGIEDSGTLITATTVEGALAENRAAIDAIEADYLTSSAIGVSVQAYDADLDTWAGLTPSANAQSLVTAANYAAMRALLDLEAGTDFYSISAADAAFQPLDADLTSLAALTTTAAGRSVLEIADPGADRILAWDDTAGAVAPIALADLTAEASPATGDYLLIYGAEGDLRKVNWSDLPSASGLANIVEDTTPQLGGNLDLNGNVITGLEIGTDVQAYDADTAKLDVENQTLAGGASVTAKNLGTQSSGTLTVDVGDRPEQYCVNGGAFTLDLSAVVGSCWLQITNNGSAGAITTTAFDVVSGDSFDTTDTNVFHCLLRYAQNGQKLLHVVAGQ